MKVKPYHSKTPGTSVYHNNNKCTERNNIEKSNIKQGTGDLSLCSHCKRLNSKK